MKKSVKKNYIYNLIYQMIVLIIPLVTTPYVSRVLGADGVGTYSYIYSIVTYFVLFGSLGVIMYGQREIAYVQDNKKQRTKVFWEIVFFRFITMLISIGTYICFFGIRGNEVLFYRIFALELISNIFDISWFFQGLEEFKKTITRNIIVKVIGVISIFIFIKTKLDLSKYILIYTLFNLLGNLTLWLYLPKYTEKIGIKELNIKKHIKPIISLFIPQIAIQVYTVLDKTMLGSILGDMTQVGNYEQSQKIIKMSLTVVAALGTVIAPRIANAIANKKDEEVKTLLEKSFKFVWMLGVPIMLGIIAISNTIVAWFLGEGYEQSVTLLKIGSLLVMAMGLNNITGMQYLIPAKKQKIYTKSVIFGAITNFVLNLILINVLKAEGAIIASVIAEFTVLLIQIYYIRNDFDIRIVYKGCTKYIISGIIMFFVCYLIGMIMQPTLITTMLQIMIGAIIYGIILIMLKEEFVYGVLITIRTKFSNILSKKRE